MRLATGLGSGLLGGLCAVALGCGSSSSLLDATQASGLKDRLSAVRSAVDERNCSAASARLKQLQSEVGNLGGAVDRELRVRLREEVNTKLAPAVRDECDDPLQETIQTTTTPAPTGPTGPVETQTETTPPPETETTPPPETIPTPTLPETETGTVPTPTVPDPTTDPGGISPDDLTP